MHERKKPSLGSGESYRALRSEAHHARDVVKSQVVSEGKHRFLINQPWGSYRETLKECFPSLETKFPDSAERITRKFDEKNARGEHIFVVNLAGAMDATNVGASKTLSITLPEERDRTRGNPTWNTVRTTEPHQRHTLIKGNLLLHRGLQTLREQIQKHGYPISGLFFTPGQAAIAYSGNRFVFRKIARALRLGYDHLAADGEIYVDLSFLEDALTEDSMRNAVGDTNAVVTKGFGKNAFLITKPSISAN